MSWEDKRNEAKGVNPRSDMRITRDYEDLFRSYEGLQRSYRALVAKHKSSIQTINKLKKELQSLKLRRLAERGLKKKVHKSRCGFVNNEVLNDREHVAASNVQEDCIQRERLLERLRTAEEQLKSLCEENSKPGSRSDSNTLSNDLRRQLSETTAKLNLLQIRNECAETRLQAQCGKLEQILVLHGEYKSKYASLKRELHDCRDENQTLEAKALENDELKELLSELTDQNAFLERQVAELTPPHVPNKEILTEMMCENQAAYDALISEHRRLKNENERLLLQNNNHDPENREESKNILRLQQQCNEKERDLQRTNHMLQAQIAINKAHEEGIEHCKASCREEIRVYQKKADELTRKSSQRLQRIRFLESKIADLGLDLCSKRKKAATYSSPHSLGPDENVLEVYTANGSLQCAELSEEVFSFVLLDFLSFESMCTSIAKGINPSYDCTVSYKLDLDRFILQNIADGHMKVEIYIMQTLAATPLLLACASISTSGLLLSGFLHIPKLKLRRPGETHPVGSVDVTLQLAQPLRHQVTEQIDIKYHEYPHTELESIFPDAIKIIIDRIVLPNDGGTEGCRQLYYFVYYHLLGDELTNLETCNDKGEIVFQHETIYPIISTPQLVEQDISWLSNGSLRFVVFSGSNDKNEHTFSIVGEAYAYMRDLLERRKLSTQIVSLESRVNGTIHILAETIWPISSNLSNYSRTCLRDNMMAKLKEVFVALANERKNCLRSQLLSIIDPPVEIAHTADILQYQIEKNCPGKALSDVFVFPSIEAPLTWQSFQRCLEETRRKGELSQIPPEEEMMDLFQYLSQKDGLVRVHLLDFFVASQSLKYVIKSFRRLKKIVIADRKNILCIDNDLEEWMTMESLTEHFESLLDHMEEDHHWLAVFSDASI